MSLEFLVGLAKVRSRQVSFAVASLLLLLLFVPIAVPAQWGAKVVTVTAAIEPAEAQKSATLTITVMATVDSKYHLYAMKQPPGEGAAPTATLLTLDPEGLSVVQAAGDWIEPKTTSKFDEGFSRNVALLYGSPLKFTRSLTVKNDAAPGEHKISGKFLYQACTETSCLPPREIPFEASLIILAADGSKPSPAPAIPAATPAPTESSTPTGTPAAPLAALTTIGNSGGGSPPAVPPPVVGAAQTVIAGKSLGWFLVSAFLFGLGALATPCVFPMIPITITFFTKQSGNSRAKSVRLALIYVVSIIAGFALIGFGISLVLLLVGGNSSHAGFATQIASNPWINLFFALLYLAFALSLFEVFEFKLPGALSGKLNQSALGRADWVGIALKALVFVVISFTCTAPLIGALIVQTLTGGGWLRPFVGMIAFATGFASPFFFLALAPQWISSLPKAGSWMYTTKIVMGLIVIAAAFKFFSNTDIVLTGNNPILTREVLLAIWASLSLVIAFYLFRFIRLPQDDTSSSIGYGRLMLGTIALMLGLYLGAGLAGGKVHVWVDSYLPQEVTNSSREVIASGAANSNSAQSNTGGTESSAGFTWFTEKDEAIAQARALGKNIFVDFTGYTCTNCRLMEKNMFPKPEVSSLLDQYVRLKLVTDDRETGQKWQDYQASTFGTIALPFYAVITPEGQILGSAEYTTNVEEYTNFLRSGLKK